MRIGIARLCLLMISLIVVGCAETTDSAPKATAPGPVLSKEPSKAKANRATGPTEVVP